MSIVARRARVAIFKNGFDKSSGLRLVMALHASRGRVASDFMRPVANLARRLACLFTMVRLIGSVAIGAIPWQCPRLFVGPVAMGAIFGTVHVYRQAIRFYCPTNEWYDRHVLGRRGTSKRSDYERSGDACPDRLFDC